jgi:hypothetical protein
VAINQQCTINGSTPRSSTKRQHPPAREDVVFRERAILASASQPSKLNIKEIISAIEEALIHNTSISAVMVL